MSRKRGAVMLALCVLLGTGGLAEARDLSLAEAIAQALAANTGLQITAQGESSAEAELREAKGNNGVTVGTSGGLNASRSKGEEENDRTSLDLSASLPLYTGGKNEANIQSASYGVDSARLTTERARETLKYDVIKAYFDALEARHTIDVDQESVDNYQAHLDNVTQLYQAGSKARIDVLRSSVELSDARQTLIRAQNDYEVDLATLRNLLNMDRMEPLTLTDDFVFDAFDISLEDCVRYALMNRKDLKVDELTVKQREEAVKSARAGYLPSVNATVGTGLSQQFEPNGRSGHDWSAGLTANWNVFDSGVTRAQVDEAKTAYDTARLTLAKDQQDADLAVRQAYYNMREAEHRLSSTEDAVGQAEQDAYIAGEKYRAGEGLMLDIIDAQTALSKARLNHISAQYDYVRYKAQVIDEMGVGLTDAEKTAAAVFIVPPAFKTPPADGSEENAHAAAEEKPISQADTPSTAAQTAKEQTAGPAAPQESAAAVADELAGSGEE